MHCTVKHTRLFKVFLKNVTRSDFKYFAMEKILSIRNKINTQPGMTKLSLVPEIVKPLIKE